MTRRGPRDLGASVRARLLQLSRQRGEDFQGLLLRFANERFLYRLAQEECPFKSWRAGRGWV